MFKHCVRYYRPHVVIYDYTRFLRKLHIETTCLPQYNYSGRQNSNNTLWETKIVNIDKIQISEDLKPILIEWLEYKKSRKETYKSEKSLQALANELTRLSNNDQTTARAIIQKSMANNWAGIFALKAEVKQDSRAGYKQQDKWND